MNWGKIKITNKIFNDYFNISKIRESRRVYKQQMQRVKDLPENYQYVFKKSKVHLQMRQHLHQLLPK